METRRLILVLGGIAVVLVIVLGGLSLAVIGGGSSSDGGSDDNATPETSPLPERVEGELRLVGPNPLTLDPACTSDTLSTVGSVYLDDIVGAKEFADGDTDEASGIEVVNDFTLRITIDAPKSYFLAKLTYPTAFVVDQREGGDSTCFSNTEWTRDPNGTAPFH